MKSEKAHFFRWCRWRLLWQRNWQHYHDSRERVDRCTPPEGGGERLKIRTFRKRIKYGMGKVTKQREGEEGEERTGREEGEETVLT